MPSPLCLKLPTVFSVADYPAGASFGPRRLTTWEFVWMIAGDAVYTWNDQEHAAPEGSVVLCRPPATDAFRWDTHRRTRHAYFHFELDGESPCSWPPIRVWPLVRTAQDGDILRPLFRHLLAWSGRGDPAQAQTFAHSLLAAFVTGQIVSGDIGGEPFPEPVERALAFISAQLDTNPATKLTLTDLAKSACVTPEHLCRLFADATDYSPMETVRLARLDRAALLLSRTNYGVAEVAALCGFDNPFHFSRRFKAAFGITPTEARDRSRHGAFIPSSLRVRERHSLGKPPAQNSIED